MKGLLGWENGCNISSMESQQKMAYTVEEAAHMLSLSRAHVYRLIDFEELRSVRIGRSRRITASQLADYLQRLEINSSQVVR